MRIVFSVLLLFLSFIPLALSAQPAEIASEWQRNTEGSARLIAGEYSGEDAWLGVQIEMAKGWKTYWRTPGDGGLPVALTFTTSENLASHDIIWPAPTRFVSYGTIENYGYKDAALLPLKLTAQDASKPLFLEGKIDYAVCEEICVFFSAPFSVTIPPGYENPDLQEQITQALNKAPLANFKDGEGLSITRWEIVREGEKSGVFEVYVTSLSPLKKPDVFIETNANFRFPAPAIHIDKSGRSASFVYNYEKLVPSESLAGQELTLTLTESGLAVQTSGTTGEIRFNQSLVIILLFALLGGLILNVMPCVLPVLSLKLLSLAKHGGSTKLGYVRKAFLTSTLGILVSFWLLAGLVIGLQQAGHAVGWGFQFQEPAFLVLMMLILTFFAANLFGWFQIQLPGFVRDRIFRLPSPSAPAPRSELSSHFYSGMLATLLATPCSAPFLGTAIGFAFSQGAYYIALIFTFMGLGLALPYILVALWPACVGYLPKPGAWMDKVKTLFGFFLLGTAIWLIWVMAGIAGTDVALGLLAFIFGILLLVGLVHYTRFCRKTAAFLLILISLGAFFLPSLLAKPQYTESDIAALWQPFDEAAIAGHVAAGRVVFVDVTADWCITCKANKLLVMDRPEAIAAFSSPDVVAMRADYTAPSPVIASYLKKHQRYGIPFNIVYGPGAPDGVALSELLTMDALLEGLKTAKGD